MPKLKILIAIIICANMLISFTNSLYAQVGSSGIAITAPINDKDAVDGDIICTYTDGNKRCPAEYDAAIFGVISDNPAAAIVDSEVTDGRLIVTSGIATVRVSSAGGDIKEGDFITSSNTSGVGMRAARNGYVVGKAIQVYSNSDKSAVGKIQILVSVHPEGKLTGTRGNLLQFIRQGISVPVFSPVESLRYLLAVLIVIISFTLGMIYFGRASRSGIEAVGRNPLAKNVIQFTVIMNIVLTIVIVLVGLAIAYLILIL
jgi:hypothetical protein